jgi:hypothetical protein
MVRTVEQINVDLVDLCCGCPLTEERKAGGTEPGDSKRVTSRFGDARGDGQVSTSPEQELEEVCCHQVGALPAKLTRITSPLLLPLSLSFCLSLVKVTVVIVVSEKVAEEEVKDMNIDNGAKLSVGKKKSITKQSEQKKKTRKACERREEYNWKNKGHKK